MRVAVLVIAVAVLAVASGVSAHSYMAERARVLASRVLQAAADGAKQLSASQVRQAAQAAAARRARTAHIEAYAAAHLAELGLADADADAAALLEADTTARDADPLQAFTRQSAAADKELKSARDDYDWAKPDDGFPWHAKDRPLHERFNDVELFGVMSITDLVPKFVAEALKQAVTHSRHSSFADFPSEGTIGALPNWHTDRMFGLQRLKGVNPRGFRRVDSYKHLTTTTAYVGAVADLQRAVARYKPNAVFDDECKAGRVFAMDYGVVDVSGDAKVAAHLAAEEQLMPSPVVVYYYAKQGVFDNLYPVSIQLLQQFDATKVQGLYWAPSDDDVKARGSAYWGWRFAKLCVSQADFMYHELGPHLAFTHLVQEIAIVTTHRELPPLHPVHALIVDHSRKTLALNHGARVKLVPIVFRFLDGPLLLTVPTLKKLWASYDFMAQMPPNDLTARGIDSTLLTGYHYADDSLALWKAIRAYTQTVVERAYADDAAVRADVYVAAWAKETSDKLPGFPKAIGTRALLTDVVAHLSFIPTAQHSAVNYLQQFWGGFIPMGPSSVHGKRWPAPNEKFTEQYVLSAMPEKHSVQLHRDVLRLLSQPTSEPITTHWGAYGRAHAKYLPGLGDGAAYETLMKAVAANDARIAARSAKQSDELKYDVLEGKRVANSILI